jgi:hypothetical protein
MSFAVVAIVPLLIAERLTRRLGADPQTTKPRGDSG